jgi:predicted nucleotidyltransferase
MEKSMDNLLGGIVSQPAAGCWRWCCRRRNMVAMPKTDSRTREIQQMVRRIVSRFHPEKIILFGSHARGDAGPDSDVDLLVVMPLLGSKLEKQLEIRLALRSIQIPKDIVVTTPEEFQWRKEILGTIERPAAREGKVLYDRA